MEEAPVRLSAERWYGMLPVPAFTSAIPENTRYSLRRFRGGTPALKQPALIEHVVAIHLGGPKRVTRWRGGRSEVFDVHENSITPMPAGSSNRWMTEGPIHYAHLVISADLLNEVAQEEFGHAPDDLTLVDKVGGTTPVVSSVLLALLQKVEGSDIGLHYQRHAVTMIVLDLLRDHSSLSKAGTKTSGQQYPHAKSGLAGWQLRRVVDFLRADLRNDADASTLARLIGISRGHLFRAFKISTGTTPLHFINHLRVEKAKSLLSVKGISMTDVAAGAGFRNERHLAKNMRLETGVSPKQFASAESVPQAPLTPPADL